MDLFVLLARFYKDQYHALLKIHARHPPALRESSHLSMLYALLILHILVYHSHVHYNILDIHIDYF